MASVVFEKQLKNIEKGLELLHEFSKEQKQIIQTDKKAKLFHEMIKSVQEANKELKKLSKNNLKKLNTGVQKFNNGISLARKGMSELAQKIKMVSFLATGMAAGITIGVANLGRGLIGNKAKAKSLGLNMQDIKGMENLSETTTGNKETLLQLVTALKDDSRNVELASHFANLSMNHDEFSKMNYMQQVQKILDRVNQNDFKNGGLYGNQQLHESIEAITGFKAADLRAISELLNGSFANAMNNAKGNTAKESDLEKALSVGKNFQVLQQQIEKFFTTFSSNLDSTLNKFMKGITEGLNHLSSNKTMQKYFQNLGDKLSSFINPNAISNAIANIPTFIVGAYNTFDKIQLAISEFSQSFTEFKNMLKEIVAKIPFIDAKSMSPTKEEKSNELAGRYAIIQQQIALAQRELENTKTQYMNATTFRLSDKAAAAQIDINKIEKELNQLSEVKIKFEHEHTYNANTKQWETKTKTTEETRQDDMISQIGGTIMSYVTRNSNKK